MHPTTRVEQLATSNAQSLGLMGLSHHAIVVTSIHDGIPIALFYAQHHVTAAAAQPKYALVLTI